ncbi:MAG: MFS transporter [Fusobacteria bacterium]|nr:MFS transporter [Fusobacteriota bacterium]
MQNKNSLTILSYLIFLFLGIIFTNWGIYIIYMSHTYHLRISTIGYLFFIPTVIQALTTFINGHHLHRANIKKQITIALILITIAILIIAFFSNIITLIIALTIMGSSIGILVALPNFIIITIHSNDKFRKLNILNFFYSFGAIIGPAYAGYLLNIKWNWKIVLLISLIVAIYLAVLNHSISYKRLGNDSHFKAGEDSISIPWHSSIYLISTAMTFYVLAECIFSIWIVAYLINYYHFPIGLASIALTLFWFFIAIGRFSAKFFQHIKIYNYILLFATIALISNICVLLTHNIIIIFILISVMGIGYSSLYACMLSYGTDQLTFNCPKLMSILVICGTIGVVLAYPVSSFFVSKFGIYVALLSGNIILFLLIISIILTLFDKKNPHSPKNLMLSK